MGSIANFFRRLGRNTSGNAMMLVAAGMPALIGGAGFAVDMTQWYMWKSELQFAVDQAAIAGAYARANEETEDTYETRAEQEYLANLSKTSEFASAPKVSLANWATGTQNSVIVTASATKTLPFSSFLTGSGTTVSVSAQAAFEEGVTFTSCLVAVDPDAEGAVTIGGSAEFIAGCGIAALSDDPLAIKVDGNPTIDAGWLIAAGGIDEWFKLNTDDTILENQDGLADPFAGLAPPTNNTPREYVCPKGKASSTYFADSVTTRTEISYAYYKRNGNTYTGQSFSGAKAPVDRTETLTDVTLSALPTSNPQVTGPTLSGYTVVSGSGGNRIYEQSTTTITKTFVNPREVTVEGKGSPAVLLPGTYSDLTIQCDTVFNSGIYVIDGGELGINAQYNVTGPGVLFVLKNGAGLTINGGADIALTGMSVSQLEAAGVSSEQAVKLAGMLIFEDPNSPGSTQNKMNGNSMTILNGTIYLPVSNLDISGSAGVTSQCLMLVASTITLTGNMEMTSFCPAGVSEDTEVVSTKNRVRLVS
jgi:Flp pilus assembly protein TadG